MTSETQLVEDLTVALSANPENPEINFSLALEYERLGQSASAVSFYLRTMEYGVKTHPLHVYTSLLKLANCFESQKDRQHTVTGAIYQAIAYLPNRPEAWFYLSRYHEQQSAWQESYTCAIVGKQYALPTHSPLPTGTDYYGQYCLDFEQAVSSYWIGRKDESGVLLRGLLKVPMTSEYRIAVMSNLHRLGISTHDVDPLEPVVTNYRKFFGSQAPVIVDVGTRDGDDANFLFQALNGSRVIAIDANPSGAELTRKNYPWMDVRFTAVGDYNGQTMFHSVVSDNKELVGCSSIISKETAMYPQDFANNVNVLTVPMTRMDAILEDSVGSIDVVKVDTEGFTWQVLQGFGDRLKDVKVFHLETERTQLTPEHVTFEHITKFMEENGFFLVDVSYEWGWGIQDQVWVNKDLAQYNREVFRG